MARLVSYSKTLISLCLLCMVLACGDSTMGGGLVEDVKTSPPGGPCDEELLCDDGNDCTQDECEAGICVSVASIGAPCDDHNLCTQDEVCLSDGSCGAGVPMTVMTDSCRVCVCDPATGLTCETKPVGTLCNDDDCCTSSDMCMACNPLEAGCNEAGVSCQGFDYDCEDENNCTQNSCACLDEEPVCLSEAWPDGTQCVYSENLCTEGDHCVAGLCQPGVVLSLDDGNPCTLDSCVKGDVVHEPVLEGQCDDGNECTMGDHCFLGTCVGSETVECELPDVCAGAASCVPGEGCVVSWLPEGAACEDQDLCSIESICSADHECVGTVDKLCDDGKDCTMDSCDMVTGDCVHIALAGGCDDGDLCTHDDLCQPDGECLGEPLDCSNSPNPCAGNTCNPESGICDLPVPDGMPCPDANLCDGSEICMSGVCVDGTPPDCSTITNPCLEPLCDAETGECGIPKPDGTSCADKDLCDGEEYCEGGVCLSGLPVNCNMVEDPCLEHLCNPDSGLCDMPKPDGTLCPDNDLCDGTEYCKVGVCTDALPIDCSWVDMPCLQPLCNDATGDCDLPKEDGTPCPNNNLCDGTETCQEGMCTAGEVVDCVGVDPCVEPVCNLATGLCDIYKPDGETCDNADLCTIDDYCDEGVCISGPDKICDDGVDCTIDDCVPEFGCSSIPDNTLCYDGDGCTYDECLEDGCENIPGEEVAEYPLDLYILQDLSGSFDDDVNIMNTVVPFLVDAIVDGGFVDPYFGLGSFIDKPTSPFGGWSDYVFRHELSLTDSGSALVAAVHSLDASGGSDEPESQIEALMQVALRADEVGFRPGAMRVVVLTTDASYHMAGHHASAGPNNGDAVLDGSPAGTGEDYPSVNMVKEKILAAGVIPIFAVTGSKMGIYENLVDQLGVGFVVQLNTNSSNLITAVLDGLTMLACPGDCCVANATPGCQDPHIADTVCATEDGCCEEPWVTMCVEQAQTLGFCP
ncbi:MAG: hypothetical protein CMH54_02705 [Myxococcales bacterium]|nr:hypothetical protein [Myxococcales bacterium]